ncbi:hypothetical protein [Leptospira interrogans]|uniref:hypothetical protein n=1 Tax=Leptospira interrogans TaxID=173 RepID=UPI0018DEE31A|nr:hypothetical protein [Leptospira interrogans]
MENSAQRFPMGRVVGLVMVESVLLSLNAGLSRALENSGVSLPLALNGKRDLSLGNVC